MLTCTVEYYIIDLEVKETTTNNSEPEKEMQIIKNTYKHVEQGFEVIVTTCNKKIATTKNLETGDTQKFNRGKFEWMINKGIFVLVDNA